MKREQVISCYDKGMNSLSFHEANTEDIPVISEILTDATQRKLKYGDTVWGSTGWTEEEIKGSLSESSVYIVRRNDEVIGTVSLQWDDERSWGVQPPIAGYLHRLAVKEGYDGQGLGTLIIDWAADQALKNGRDFLRLDCEERNTQLCAYYEKLGFVRVGSQAIPEYGDYVGALYQRPLTGR